MLVYLAKPSVVVRTKVLQTLHAFKLKDNNNFRVCYLYIQTLKRLCVWTHFERKGSSISILILVACPRMIQESALYQMVH